MHCYLFSFVDTCATAAAFAGTCPAVARDAVGYDDMNWLTKKSGE